MAHFCKSASYCVLLACFILALGFIVSLHTLPAYAKCDPATKLGVSRTITVSAAGGPLFGKHQYTNTLPLNDKEVVLTFDDGPHPVNTLSVLKTLKDHCTKATFFPVGQMIKTYPHILKKVAEDGHTIGAHTHTHRFLPDLSFKTAILEVERSFAEAIKVLGQPIAPFFRYPGLRHSKKVNAYLKSRNIAVMSVDVISFDTRDRNTKRIVNNTLRNLEKRGRGMILLHDLKKATAKAMPALLEALQQNGYRVVHIIAEPSQKIATTNYTPSARDKHIFRRAKRKSVKRKKRLAAKKRSRKNKRRSRLKFIWSKAFDSQS